MGRRHKGDEVPRRTAPSRTGAGPRRPDPECAIGKRHARSPPDAKAPEPGGRRTPPEGGDRWGRCGGVLRNSGVEGCREGLVWG